MGCMSEISEPALRRLLQQNTASRRRVKTRPARIKEHPEQAFWTYVKTRFCVTGDYGVRTGKYGLRTGKFRVIKKQVGEGISGCFGFWPGIFRFCLGFVWVKPGFRQATCFPGNHFCTNMQKKLSGHSNAHK